MALLLHETKDRGLNVRKGIFWSIDIYIWMIIVIAVICCIWTVINVFVTIDMYNPYMLQKYCQNKEKIMIYL